MQQTIDLQIQEVLQSFPQLNLVILFGSIALGRQQPNSDLDIALAADLPLNVQEKIAMIGALAERTGRPVDLVDLKVVTEPLLGQIRFCR
jgi:predicted nucleotidyltransferase